MRKTFILCSLVFLILLITVSCQYGTQQNNSSSVVDAYRNAAQNFIDSGDVDSAIKALEEGVAATNDETLKAMLAELISGNAKDTSAEDTDDENAVPETSKGKVPETSIGKDTEKPTLDYSEYAGKWKSDFDSLTIIMQNDSVMYVEYKGYSCGGEAEFDLSHIVDNALTFTYDNYLHEPEPTGNITLRFVNGLIEYDIVCGEYNHSSAFERYSSKEMTLEVYDRMVDHSKGIYKTILPTSNARFEVYVEGGVVDFTLWLNNGTSEIIIYCDAAGYFVEGEDGNTRGYVKPDTLNGNSVTYRLVKAKDSDYGDYVDCATGDQGSVTFTFEDDKISYQINDFPETLSEYAGEFIVVSAEEEKGQITDEQLSWLELSGMYVDDGGEPVALVFVYDEASQEYLASWDGAVLDSVSVDGNELSGMLDNADAVFTYDEKTGYIEFYYFNYTSRYSFTTNYSLISAFDFTAEEAKACIERLSGNW